MAILELCAGYPRHRRNRTVLIGLLVAGAWMMVIVPSASAARYAIRDLDTLGGPTSTASAINDLGEVTGMANTSYPPEVFCGNRIPSPVTRSGSATAP